MILENLAPGLVGRQVKKSLMYFWWLTTISFQKLRELAKQSESE